MRGVVNLRWQELIKSSWFHLTWLLKNLFRTPFFSLLVGTFHSVCQNVIQNEPLSVMRGKRRWAENGLSEVSETLVRNLSLFHVSLSNATNVIIIKVCLSNGYLSPLPVGFTLLMHRASNSPLRYISLFCFASSPSTVPLHVPVRVLLTLIGLSTEYTRVEINIIVVNPKKSQRNSAYLYGSAIPRHLKTQRLHARVQGK